MSIPTPASERRIDKVVVLVCAATLAGLYLFLFRVLEGSWANMGRDIGGILAPVVVYLGLVVSIMVPVTRRGGSVKRWWVLLLLPSCGAVAGIVAHVINAGQGTVVQAMVMGATYGAVHALLLRWSRQREAQGARPTTA